jgi:protein involved in polysaccharide export with SLBB domain
MHRGSSSLLTSFTVLVFLISSSLFSYGQVPSGTIPNIPNITTPPVNMTNPQLQTLLKDQNADAGKDRNKELEAELYKNKKVKKDSLSLDDVRSFATGPKSTYGANVFSSAANVSLSELSTPPLDYPIGVGDHVVVSGYGGAEFQKDYLVGTDGSVFPNGMGKIYIGGNTFENVRRLLYARFSAVVPPETNITISLGQPRTININVVNEVNNPGIITVSAFSNAFNVIAKAGGVTENGNLRNIQIKRNGRVIEELDIYKYLQTGDFGKHSYLQNNDFIIVPFYEKKVLATGQFKRPMYYQLKKDEGVRALLRYSGGLNADALASSLQIIRSDNEDQTLKNVNATAIIKIAGQDAILKDGDIVKADLIKSGLVNKVEIKGEIKYPDIYEYRKGDRVFDLINRAGGVTRNTYLQRAYVFRGAGDSTNLQATGKLEVDLTDINNNDLSSKNNIELMPNDVVQLFGTYEFTDPVFVEIFGEIRKEGKVRKTGGMTLQDLIYLSGGIKPSAEFGRLEISSIVDIDSAKEGIKPTRNIVKAYAISSNLQVDSAAAKIILKPYDQIFVRKNPTFELQQNIEIKGLIKYPGLYPRLDKYEKLSSYIARAGGFKDNADLGGAVLLRRQTENFRERIVRQPKYDNIGNLIADSSEVSIIDEPVSIDLYKALKNKNSKFDIVLQANDVIFIPEINPFVTVKGRVQSPLKISFDKEHTNVRYYLDKAGGLGVRPWRGRIFVTYANGRSKRTKSLFFFHFYPPVEQGSVITVPIRPEGQEVTDVVKSTITSLVPVLLTAFLLKYIK